MCDFLSSASPSLLVLCETWHPEVSAFFDPIRHWSVPNYQLYLSDKTCAYAIAGGVGVYVKNGLPCELLSSLSQPLRNMDTPSSLLFLRLRLPAPILVGAVYIHPDATAADRARLSSCISHAVSLSTSTCPLLLLGDCNARHTDWLDLSCNRNGSFLSTQANTHSLVCLNTLFAPGEVTYPHSGAGGGSIIDLAFITDASQVDHMAVDTDTPLASDHHPIVVRYSNRLHEVPLGPTFPHERWNIHERTDWGRFKESLQLALQVWLAEYPDSSLSHPSALSTAFHSLMRCLLDVGESCIGWKEQRIHGKYWFKQPQVQQAIREYRTANRRYLQRRSDQQRQQQRQAAKRHLQKTQREARRECFRQFANTIQEETDMLPTAGIHRRATRICWSTWTRNRSTSLPPLSCIRATPSATNPSPTLPASLSQSLDNLCQFYSDTSRPAATHVSPSRQSAIDESNIQLARGEYGHDPVTDVPFTVKEVAAVCRRVRSRSAMGPDRIAPLFLKEGGRPLHIALHRLFNSFYRHHFVPDEFKQGNVISLHKKGSRNDPNNYRPICLTSILARSYERLLKPRLLALLQPQLHSLQFGFRPQRSTLDSLLQHAQVIHASFRAKRVLPVAYLDFNKAFDRVDLPTLLYKCRVQMGIQGHLLAFLHHFLTGRRIRTVYANLASHWQWTHGGVPQGSVLAPLLFLIFINDLLTLIHTRLFGAVKALAFADDICLLPIVPGCWPGYTSISDCNADALQAALHLASMWAADNRMLFNRDKSNIVLYRQHCVECRGKLAAGSVAFQLTGFTMPIVPSYTYLGIVFHQHLSWKEQFTTLKRKLQQVSYLICRLLTPEVHAHIAAVLVNATLRACISYAFPFWRPNRSQYQQLNSLLAAPLRRSLCLPTSTHVNSLLFEFGIPDSSVLREYLLLSCAIRFHSLPPNHPSKEALEDMKRTAANDRHFQSRRFQSDRSPFYREVLDLEGKWQLTHRQSDSKKTLARCYPQQTRRKYLSDSSESLTFKSCSVDTPFRLSPYLHLESPAAARLRARIRHNRALTNQRLHTIRHRDNPYCDTCGPSTRETCEHLLLQCPRFDAARADLRSACWSLSFLPSLSQPIRQRLLVLSVDTIAAIGLESCPSIVRQILRCTSTFLHHIHRNRPF
jgi:endonuclease/exonuclease/phosphatase family metal-dependent hydrolase